MITRPYIDVIAIDPGIDTGWAWGRVESAVLKREGAPTALLQGEWEAGQIMGTGNENRNCWNIVAMIKDHLPTDEIVMEDFILREYTKDRSLLSPVRVIAKVEAMLWCQGIEVPIHFQQASQAKSTVTSIRMKRWGIWITGQRHARDGLRHLVLRLMSLEKSVGVVTTTQV